MSQWKYDLELQAYVTIDGLVHGCVWRDRKDGGCSNLVVLCTKKIAPNSTRTSAKREVITCAACQVIGWA